MGQNKRYYRGRAKEWTIGVAGTGKPQIAVLCDILTPGATHAQLIWYGFFTEETWERTYESLQHFGWEGEDPTELENSGGNLSKNEVDLVVEDEEYPPGSGQWRTKVQWVNKPRTAAVKAPLEGDARKTFAEQMRMNIRAKKAASGQKVSAPRPANGSQMQLPPQRQPEPPPLSDDDIPF